MPDDARYGTWCFDCHKPALAADFVTAIAIAIRAGWRRIATSGGVRNAPPWTTRKGELVVPRTARFRKHASRLIRIKSLRARRPDLQ
jgi:hypothetical protein